MLRVSVFATKVIFLSSLLFASSLSFGHNSHNLPEPGFLKKDVRFWENIFTKYRPNHCVIHDRTHLNAIYIVKDVGRSSNRVVGKRIRKEVRKVATRLRRLGKGYHASTSLDHRIVAGTPKHLRSSRFYRRAANNVRCQRGVDLAPSFKRSKKYISMIKREFRSLGLPTDLAYLPHLESSFNRTVRSKAGARGIWQLMPWTARSYKLRIGRKIDQRTHPKKSTRVAAKILKKLYSQTKSWPLAITAYNYGENGMRRAIKKYGRNYKKIRTNHRTAIFKFAAKNYYPSFLAVRNVAKRRS